MYTQRNMYKLTVTKSVENPDYKSEYRKYQANNQNIYWRDKDIYAPVRFYPEKAMEVELTDEEFKKLKAETIKIFN